MSEQSHLARPYAHAIFAFAQAQGESLSEWNHALDLLAMIVVDPDMAACIRNPRVSAAQIQDTIFEVAAAANKVGVEKLHPPMLNLVKLLVRNQRLAALPAIAQIFAELRAGAERVVSASLLTAREIDAVQRKQFSSALAQKLGCEVELEFAVDESIIGGAIVRAGDQVIDGSVRAQLEQLVGAVRA